MLCNYLHLSIWEHPPCDYGSAVNHQTWGFIVFQFPFTSQSSPKATLWLMSTLIQHKINWFHSRRVEMVRNITTLSLAVICIVFNQQEAHRRKKRKKKNIFFFPLNKVRPSSTECSDTDVKVHTNAALPQLEMQGCRDIQRKV